MVQSTGMLSECEKMATELAMEGDEEEEEEEEREKLLCFVGWPSLTIRSLLNRKRGY